MNWKIVRSQCSYVGILGGGCMLGLFMVRCGLDPAISVGLVGLFTVSVLFIAQRVAPYRCGWRNWASQLGIDALHGIFSTLGFSALCQAALIGGVYFLADWAARLVGSPLWPTELPFLLQCLLALMVADFGAYWFHRLAHRSPLVWRVHALHHSSEQLYVLSSARNHPLNVFGTFIVSVVPLALLGVHGEVLLFTGIFTTIHGMLQHANVDFQLGFMNWILAGPELHRFHHSASFEESNTNFGSNLIIWDVIFRTRHLPKDMHVAAIGLEEKVFQHNYWQQLAVPFQWRLYMKKARMRAAAVAEHPLSQMWTSPPPSSPS